ncbi:MerR family transcriptional regulator [Nocardiopsis sediminis]|uniref:MerR family transcriptional regulator n=1 Tax=Nocardiopsis sediminis TaxID=1778267 RepID=A0ABV8FPL3_9ACTN
MDEPLLPPSAVAHLLGVAPTTLRSWDRRYGIGPDERTRGGHRRYSAASLDRLRVMCRLVAEGVAPADAAEHALAGNGSDSARIPQPRPSSRATNPGGGNTLPLGRSGPTLQGIARAAVRMDADTVEVLLEEAFRTRGAVAAWQDLAMPLLVGMGLKWEGTRRNIEVEHLLTWSVSSVLRRSLRPRASYDHEPMQRSVLLVCTPDEQHTLALEALAAALSENGVHWRMLGAATPVAATVATIERTAPSAVVVWCQTPETADLACLAAAHRAQTTARQRSRLLTAGPGWGAVRARTGVGHLASLPQAISLLSADGSASWQRR